MMKFVSVIVLFFGAISLHAQNDYTADVDSALMRGDAYVAKYQYAKAAAHYYECVRSDKTNTDYLNKLAFCYYQLGTYKDAKIYYNQALKQDSSNITAHIYLGSIAERESEYAMAAQYYDRLIEIDSTVAHYYKIKAKVEMKLGNPLKAFYAYNEALYINPMDIETIGELAKIYLQSDELDSADEMIAKGRRINSDNLTLKYLQVNVAYKRDSFHQVIPIMEEILERGDTVNHYEKLLALSYMEEDRFEDARIHLIRLTKNENPNELTYYRLAQAYDQLDSTAQSIAAYKIAIRIGISANVSAYYKNMGILNEELKDTKAALDAYAEAYHFSKKPEDLFHLARCQEVYYADKKIALNNYRKFLRQKGDKEQILVDYAESRIAAIRSEIFQRGG